MKPLPGLAQRIRERAYLIWLDEGRPEGRDNIHWQMAAELVAKQNDQRTTLRLDRYLGPTGTPTKHATASDETKKPLRYKRLGRHRDYVRYWTSKALAKDGHLETQMRKVWLQYSLEFGQTMELGSQARSLS
jgi:hypothetical protein